MSWTCTDCNKVFATAQKYSRHKNKKIPCDIVKKKHLFASKKMCGKCSKVFSSYQMLDYHKNICKIDNNIIGQLKNKIIEEEKIIKEKDDYIAVMEKKFEMLQKQIDQIQLNQVKSNANIIINNNYDYDKDIVHNINVFNIC